MQHLQMFRLHLPSPTHAPCSRLTPRCMYGPAHPVPSGPDIFIPGLLAPSGQRPCLFSPSPQHPSRASSSFVHSLIPEYISMHVLPIWMLNIKT